MSVAIGAGGFALSLNPACAVLKDFSFDAATVTYAGANTYDFTEAGFRDGASITGFFVGADSDADGQISAFEGEFTDFGLSF